MKPRTALGTAFAFVVLVLLQYTLRPLLGWPLGPDFLLMAVVVASVRVRPGTAAVIGLLVGLVADSIGTDPFGASALAFTVVGFAASWVQGSVFADDLTVDFLLFFAGEWVYSAIFLFAARTSSAAPILAPLLVWAPVRALVTALFGVATLAILRPVLRPASAS
ncbi:MAG TPA: rod shape-determining protein MreD [Gemmatimonadaceae bacterium]|nr:rod shape-determining protein MreD [Gemmatimonadaceae bacterium]